MAVSCVSSLTEMNRCASKGGAIMATSSTLVINNSSLTDNTAMQGGAIYLDNSNGTTPACAVDWETGYGS